MSGGCLAEMQGDFQPLTLPGAYGVSVPATRGTEWRKVRLSMAFLWRRISPIQLGNGDFAADRHRTTLLRHSLLRSFQEAC